MSDIDLNTKIQNGINFGLEAAKKLGAEHCEAYGLNQRAFNLELEKNKPKHNLGIMHGLSFRVIANNALGFAYTSSFKEEDIKHTVKLAIQNAQTKKKDPDLKPFPSPMKSTEKLPIDEDLYNIDAKTAASDFGKMLETELPKNTYFLQAFGFVGAGEEYIKSSLGMDIVEKGAGYGYGIMYLSTHGFPTYEIHVEGSRSSGGIDPAKISEIALEKTLKSSKPQTMTLSGEYPTIITPEGSYGIFGGLFTVLTQLLRGDKASRGETVFADRIGDQIAIDNFTLIDDPLRNDLMTSALYDAEGVPTQRTTLIDKGVLQTYYLDSYYAGKLNMESNGKATKGAGMFGGNPIKSPPGVGSFASVIEPGDSSVDEMIAETKEGFMLKNFMGIHMSDLSSGRFAVTGSGWYIKNGELRQPVQDISVAGTIPDLLQNIDMISKERKKGLNNEVPYLRISELEITAKKLDFKIRFGMKVLKAMIKLGLAKNPFV